MKATRQLFYLFLVTFAIQALFTSCEKNNEVEDNGLVNTEWADDSGTWLLSFKSSNTVSLTYNIMAAGHSFKFDNLNYRKDGQDIIITEKVIKEAHGLSVTVMKDFKGKLSSDLKTLTCDFITSQTESDSGEMPDFSKLVSAHVIMKKK